MTTVEITSPVQLYFDTARTISATIPMTRNGTQCHTLASPIKKNKSIPPTPNIAATPGAFTLSNALIATIIQYVKASACFSCESINEPLQTMDLERFLRQFDFSDLCNRPVLPLGLEPHHLCEYTVLFQ